MTEKKAVSNSSPIILAAKIGFLPVLKKMYRYVLIPHGVYKEITSKRDEQIENSMVEGLFQVRTVQNITKRESLLQFMGIGEIESILLSEEIHADILFIDDKKGKYYANSSGIKTVGIVGLIIKAYQEGLIDDFANRLNQLIKAGFWMKKNFVEEILRTVLD